MVFSRSLYRPQNCIVADFGCGEAKIAQSVKQKVHSFDIFPANERVTVCNISKVEWYVIHICCLEVVIRNWLTFCKNLDCQLADGVTLTLMWKTRIYSNLRNKKKSTCDAYLKVMFAWSYHNVLLDRPGSISNKRFTLWVCNILHQKLQR